MPLITPNENESRDDFLSRCAGDEKMNKEFPDSDQRLAVCGKLYDNKDSYERAVFALAVGVTPSQRLVSKFRSNVEEDGKLYTWDVEVFAVGTWNGYPFKKEDLESMVDAYKTLNGEGVLDAPLKFGHNDEQQMTDGYPALGWIDELYIKNDDKGRPKLWARFTDVPEIVYKAAQNKRYRKVSIELEFDVKHKGRLFPYVVTGIALLGADLPAVNTLADLNAYMGRPHLESSRREAFSAVSGNITERNDNMAEINDEELATLRAKAAKADAAETAAETYRKAEKDRVTKDARDKVNAALDAAVVDLRITPVQRASFAKVLKVEDDEVVTSITPEDIESLLPAKVTGESRSYGRSEGEQEGAADDTDDVLHEAARKLIEESGGKMKYSRALELAMMANRETAKKHLGLGAE